MKKMILLLSCLMYSVSILTNMPPSMPGGGAMLPMPSQQEMQEIQKFLDTLSPEELDELAKIGEEIIQTAEKEGRPLFGPAPDDKQKPQPSKPKTVTPTTKPQEQAKPKERVLSSKEKARIQRILSGLIESIASIRQKATSDEILLQLITPLNTTLNDLTYYLNVVNYSKHLVQLTSKEFTPLNDNLRKLYEQIDEIDSQLNVPEIEMSKKQSSDDLKKNRNEIKQAEKTINKFTSIIETTIKQKHVLMDLERLVKKYEPEALKIKKEQEEKEKKASTQRTSLPATNVSQTYRAPSSGQRPTQRYTGGSAGRSGGYNSSPNYHRPSSGPTGSTGSARYPGTSGQPQSGSNNSKAIPSNAKKDVTSPEQNKKKATEKDETPRKLTEAEKTQSLEKEIQKKMELVNHLTGSQNDKLTTLLDQYLSSADPIIEGASEEYNNAVQTISYNLKKIKKDVTKWVSKIDDQASDHNEFNKHRKRLKIYMENSMKEVHAFHKKVKDNPGLLAQNSARVEEHKDSITQLVKHVDDIKKELSKAP